MAKKSTKTATFGTGKREGHDSSSFYQRRLYQGGLTPVPVLETGTAPVAATGWENHIYNKSAEAMKEVPDGAVGLAFTSPPYNNGKEYDLDLSLEDYLAFIRRVGTEVFRVLAPGGRYVINIANQGRKPYIPYTALFWQLHQEIGFYPLGEIIWIKARGASGSCAWGSWQSAKSPRLRDVHEYLLVLGKGDSRPDAGESTISREEFLEYTLSTWEIQPESARRVGHPAPFPLELALRVIKLFSYKADVVLDPFAGSGTTLVAAKQLSRRFVGYEIVPGYCELAVRRLEECDAKPQN